MNTMYKCLAVFDSGNYVYRICNLFEKKGLVFEVNALPCKLAKEGCGYCLKFPEEYKDQVVEMGNAYKMPVREMFRIIPQVNKNNYQKIL